MELFKEYPELEDDLILIHRLSQSDAPALASLAGNDKVYRFEPTFLYERKYKDSAYAIEHLDQECFETGQSMIMGVYLRSEPDVMVGLAEIYNYEERKQKASIGYRLDERYWGRGIATRIARLLKNYLMEKTDIRTITAHVMKENIPSAKVLMHNGFIDKYPDVYGDWGFKELTHTDKYVFKRSWMGREFGKTLKVDVEKFVLRFMTDSRKILESLPSGCTSLSPEIRINTEIRDDDVVCMRVCTPVMMNGRKGWLQLSEQKSSSGDDVYFIRNGNGVSFRSPDLSMTFRLSGDFGSCPDEGDMEGTFVIRSDTEFRPVEKIDSKKEFCYCSLVWENGAFPCNEIIESYVVRFERSYLPSSGKQVSAK